MVVVSTACSFLWARSRQARAVGYHTGCQQKRMSKPVLSPEGERFFCRQALRRSGLLLPGGPGDHRFCGTGTIGWRDGNELTVLPLAGPPQVTKLVIFELCLAEYRLEGAGSNLLGDRLAIEAL